MGWEGFTSLWNKFLSRKCRKVDIWTSFRCRVRIGNMVRKALDPSGGLLVYQEEPLFRE